jgi:beta-xylosidase
MVDVGVRQNNVLDVRSKSVEGLYEDDPAAVVARVNQNTLARFRPQE